MMLSCVICSTAQVIWVSIEERVAVRLRHAYVSQQSLLALTLLGRTYYRAVWKMSISLSQRKSENLQ